MQKNLLNIITIQRYLLLQPKLIRHSYSIYFIIYMFFYRIKPVILGNGRCIQSDAVISGYEVPKGVCVLIILFTFGSK